MPRRRPTKAHSGGSKPKPFKKADGKLKKWNTLEDIPLDDEDQFHASRDKILLEGEDYGGDSDGDDDEVFALKGLEDDEEGEEDGEDLDEDIEEYGENEEDERLKKKPTKTSKKSKSKRKSSSSDEEEESEPEESWGRTKGAWYSSNADQIESDDEEANELEEQEAKRLQKKAREDLTENDFGLNDSPETDKKDGFEDVVEPAPAVLPALPSDKKALLRHLEKTSPETLALARDWSDAVETLTRTKAKIEKTQTEDPDAVSLGMMHLHYQALLSYTTLLAFYLHLRASPKYAQRPDSLKAHPILQRLLTLKQSLSTLEDLDFAASDSEDYSDEESFEESIDEDDEDADFDEDKGMDWEAIMKDMQKVTETNKKRRGRGMDAQELAELLWDAENGNALAAIPKPEKPPKKKRKTSKEDASVPIFDLEEPEFMPVKKSSLRSLTDNFSDAFGEATQLQQADAADKSARKKSLRFHTSKIESTSAKRQGARNQAVGGDDDIPYRERKKDREDRMAREAKNRVKSQGGADLDDTEPEPWTAEKRRREDDSGDENDEGAEGYYELVKKKSKEKKEQKKKEYEATQAALRPDLDDGDVSGPRSLTRAILKNKGLTPHRSKSVRNPRVKKRQKFEKANKKVASQRAVYKGGVSETGGRYDGERSGISKVVKGVRLA